MIALYSPDCALQSKSKFIKIGLITGYFQILKFCGHLKFFRGYDYERDTLYFLCAVVGALCDGCYRQRYSVAAKCERRRHRERDMCLGKGRNFTASFEVKF